MKKATNFDEYIAEFPNATQKILKQLRATVRKAAPESEEKISYGMPAFTLHKRNLVYFAGYKNHIGLYPAPIGIEAFKKEFSGYKTGKGSVQFPLDRPMPFNLIARIVKFRVKENEKKTEKGKTSKKNHIVYHKDGSVWARGKMTDGKTDGYWKWFRKDGTIMRSGYFRKNKQVGKWTTYDKNGKVYKITAMK